MIFIHKILLNRTYLVTCMSCRVASISSLIQPKPLVCLELDCAKDCILRPTAFNIKLAHISGVLLTSVCL